MPQTRTIYVNFGSLLSDGQSATTVVKLMMACNDLSLLNEALGEWMKEQPGIRRGRQRGAKMYFMRMQLAHLHEALKIIEAIRRDQSLSNLVGQCDTETQESFHKLEKWLPGGMERARFEKLVGRIRHNLAFHYEESGKLIDAAMADRSQRPEAQTSSMTRGSETSLWHFQLADDVVDSIVVRQIWGIPRPADLRAEADRISEEVRQILLSFVDFSSEFIWKYCTARSC